jgi:hypothetical protein
VALTTTKSFADDSVVVGGDDRPVSKFKIGDEWLALPEVFSNLDFAGEMPIIHNVCDNRLQFG